MAVPVGSSREGEFGSIFLLIAFAIGAIWFLKNAASAFKKNKTSLLSLYLSSTLMFFLFSKFLLNSIEHYENNRSEAIDDIFIFTGILLSILTINIIATNKLKKRLKKKELVE